VAIDLGTGDGRYVLARATRCPDELTIGIDADAASMAEAGRRATRGGVGNAVLVAADALGLPDELAGLAELVTIHFPWGSLLHAAACADGALTRLVGPGGRYRVLLSSSAADATAGLTQLDPLALERACLDAGLDLVASRPASFDDARAAYSSWGKRLLRNPGPGRAAWLLEARRPR
jgi:16S rRNA (adenine(1408)-N(1))-methyltransferase